MTASLIPRTAVRAAARASHVPTSAQRIVGGQTQRSLTERVGARRWASTTGDASVPPVVQAPPPPRRKGSTWRGMFARWALAGGIVYYYNTSPLFADEPPLLGSSTGTEHLPTLESIAASTARTRQQRAASSPARELSPAKDTTLASTETAPAPQSSSPSGAAAALEAEADGQGAFNPETGEINWDCPCLGGMAHGPCGEEFRAAFSCFVYSKEEPKGVECIDKFKGMQDCFRAHPEIYASELADAEDEDDDDDVAASEVNANGASVDQDEDAAKYSAKEPAGVSKQEETNK